MEEPIIKPGLPHSVREIVRIIRLSFREAVPKTRATDHAGFKTPGFSVFLIRCILCFAKYRVPYSVNEYILYRNSYGKESVYHLCPAAISRWNAIIKHSVTAAVSVWAGEPSTKRKNAAMQSEHTAQAGRAKISRLVLILGTGMTVCEIPVHNPSNPVPFWLAHYTMEI